MDSLARTVGEYAGARIELREFENGPPIKAPNSDARLGENLDTLRAISRVERTLKATAGTQYVVNPMRVNRKDLQVALNREKAGLVGVIHRKSIARCASACLGSVPVKCAMRPVTNTTS